MAIRDFFTRRSDKVSEASVPVQEPVKARNIEFEVGAREEDDIGAYENSNITFQGELKGFDYNHILRDKQRHIVDLYRLADYYYDADPIVHGIIAHVFVPFCSNGGWYLTGKEKTVKLFEKYYDKIRLREKISDIMLQFAKYGNCFVYLLDGNIITLPVHKVRIGNTMLNGKPILEYDCQSIVSEWHSKGYTVKENWIEDSDLKYILKGYPPEIAAALNKLTGYTTGAQYVQLNPENTYALQMPKEGWLRYAIPFIATALPALARKELIKQYEEAMLNIGARSFVHVRYGDEKSGYDILPDRNQLNAVYAIFRKAMNGKRLAVTNQLAKAEVISPDMSDLYQWPMYTTVNEEILSAGGISGIIVNGVSDEGSSFSTAQVSMQTAESRINAMRREFEDMMNRINERAPEFIKGVYNLKETPEFHFEPLSLTGEKALRDACMQLWTQGVVSTKTMLEKNGYSFDKEKELREKEADDGTDKIFTDRATQHADKVAEEQAKLQMKMQKTQTPATESTSTTSTTVGRPKLDDSERHSDPAASDRGSMPKPSNESGSGANKI